MEILQTIFGYAMAITYVVVSTLAIVGGLSRDIYHAKKAK
jgi:hypothetical protein